jgi:hypothetical protein
MHRLLIIVVLAELSLSRPTAGQSTKISLEKAIQAIRGFREFALDRDRPPVALNFCAVPDAFDEKGSLRGIPNGATVAYSTRASCAEPCVATSAPVVCFGPPRRQKGELVFVATRLDVGGAAIAEEYLIEQTPRQRAPVVKVYRIVGFSMP